MTGLPLAGAFQDAGLRVVGFERDARRRRAVEEGDADLLGVPRERWFPSNGPRIDATADFARAAECEALFLCLPTPLGSDGEPDLTAIEDAARAVAPHLAAGALVVLCSTTWPGTTRQRLLPWLEDSGPRRLGEDLYVGYSPEREDPGSGRRTKDVPRLASGLDAASATRTHALLARAIDTVVDVPTCETAEAAKLLENVFRAVNIALVNEAKQVLDALGVDVWPVVRAAATKPYGFMSFEPGPGLGGHCIPVDPLYLTGIAKRAGRPSRLVELAAEINRAVPVDVADKLASALEVRGSSIAGARVLVLGAAYKPGVSDTRESPGLRIMELLEARGARADHADPLVPELCGDVPPTLAGRRAVVPSDAELASYDAVVLAVRQPGVDLERVARLAKLVVDTRDAFRDLGLDPERLVRA
ncbi:MAG: nucleotide sugar dehydrogenase [Planctomycetota bacterium]